MSSSVTSWPAYRFLKRQVRWSSIPVSWRIFQFYVIYTVKGFGIVNKSEKNVFLELFCFFEDSTDAGNLISSSSAFSKSSLNIWKFIVLVKPGLEISSHSHSIVFLYFFALIIEEGFLISPCYSLEHCIQMGMSFLFFFVFCFPIATTYLLTSNMKYFSVSYIPAIRIATENRSVNQG